MIKLKPTKPVPGAWQQYIKSLRRKYASSVFDPDDVEQIALETFLKARQRYQPAKGPFENYAKAAIRNALVNASAAEQRHHHQREYPEHGATVDVVPEPWFAEDARLDEIMASDRAKAVAEWRARLTLKPAAILQGLYFEDLSQRALALREGVTQARICQRNRHLLAMARAEIPGLVPV